MIVAVLLLLSPGINFHADEADDAVKFTLEEDGAVKFSKTNENNDSAFVKINLDTQVMSGFTKTDGSKNISFPHPTLESGKADATLNTTGVQKEIIVDSSLNESVTFGGN